MLYRIKLLWCTLVFTCICKYSVAQFTIIDFPKQLQLFPRNNNNYASVNIHIVSNDTLAIIKTKTTQNGSVITSDTFNSNTSGIYIIDSIYADTVLYQYCLYKQKNWNNILLQSDSIVAGDIIIASGQSNMEAEPMPSYTMNGISNVWLRSFGSSTTVNAICYSDTSFYLSQAQNSKRSAYVGVLLYYTANNILKNTNIPILIINGAVGGTSIESHLPFTDIYNRFKYRIQKSGASNHIKSFIWYQGENNTNQSYSNYYNHFKSIYNSLNNDIGNFDLIIMQIRHGCLGAPDFRFHKYLRNVQRTFSDSFANCIVLSAMGKYDFDSCHFYSTGYKELSLKISNAILFKSFGMFNNSVLPPKLELAFYKDSTHIVLKFDKSILLDSTALVNGKTKYAKSIFYLNNDTLSNINSYTIQNDKLILNLNNNSIISDSIWYTPERTYSDTDNIIFDGPYITDNLLNNTPTFGEAINKELLVPPSVSTIKYDCLLKKRYAEIFIPGTAPFTLYYTKDGLPYQHTLNTNNERFYFENGNYYFTQLVNPNDGIQYTINDSFYINSIVDSIYIVEKKYICDSDKMYIKMHIPGKAPHTIFYKNEFNNFSFNCYTDTATLFLENGNWVIINSVDDNLCSYTLNDTTIVSISKLNAQFISDKYNCDSAYHEVLYSITGMKPYEITYKNATTYFNQIYQTDTILLKLTNDVYQIISVKDNMCELGINDSIQLTYTPTQFQFDTSVFCTEKKYTLYVDIQGESPWYFKYAKNNTLLLDTILSKNITYSLNPDIYHFNYIEDRIGCIFPINTSFIFNEFMNDSFQLSTFTNIIKTDIIAYKYNWYKNNEIITNHRNQECDAPTSGMYQLKVWDQNNCEYWSKPIMIKHKNHFEIYPTQLSDILYIDITDNFSLPLNINIYNQLGQNVYKSKLYNLKNQIQLSGLQNGIYYLQIFNAEKNILNNAHKFIKK